MARGSIQRGRHVDLAPYNIRNDTLDVQVRINGNGSTQCGIDLDRISRPRRTSSTIIRICGIIIIRRIRKGGTKGRPTNDIVHDGTGGPTVTKPPVRFRLGREMHVSRHGRTDAILDRITILIIMTITIVMLIIGSSIRMQELLLLSLLDVIRIHQVHIRSVGGMNQILSGPSVLDPITTTTTTTTTTTIIIAMTVTMMMMMVVVPFRYHESFPIRRHFWKCRRGGRVLRTRRHRGAWQW